MIAQYFPPAGGVGTFRVTKFVKHLRQSGWEPVILTEREDYYPEKAWFDRGLEKDIPQDVRIYRTKVWRSRIINDEGIRWLPCLLSAVARVIRKERPQIVYITGGPFFPLIAGPLIKGLFHLPYVIDLRDPWRLARCGSKRTGLKTRIGRLLTDVLEPWVVRCASKVICVSNAMCAEYRECYRLLPEGRFAVITNGYDPDDFAHCSPALLEKPTIVYAGKFRTSESFRNPVLFFRAMKLLADRGRHINFLHIGQEEREVSCLAEQEGVTDQMVHIGPLSYSETIAYCLGADVLLLIGGGQPTEQTGKVFDYIGCGKPILAMAPKKGEIARILKEIPGTWVLEHADPGTIASLLDKLCFGANQPCDMPKLALVQYQRRHLTSVLSKVLDEVSLSAPGNRGSADDAKAL